jgi:hypothetical protein
LSWKILSFYFSMPIAKQLQKKKILS